ncbi:cell envelope integrity protein TolA [Enterobacteriaceae bacterium C34A]
MKKFLLVATLVLAGCQATGQSAKPATVDKQIDAQVDELLASAGKPDSQSDIQSISWYAGQIKTNIEKNFVMKDAYRDKKCTVRMAFERDGTVTSTQAEEGGDPALCKAIQKAVAKAKMPPAPNEQIYQMFNNEPLDFRL